MLYKDYFKKKKINQEILNKKINWFYDIKSIHYQKKKNYKVESLKYAKILKKNYFALKKNKSKIKLKENLITIKKLNTVKFSKKDRKFKLVYLKLFKFLKEKGIEDYVKHFCIHGSIASDDYVKGWSDFDTFVVLKDSTMLNVDSIIKLRNILKIFYSKLLKVSYFQHHGLIIFTELDLNNYLKGYLPKEALEKSFSIFGAEKIIIKKNYSKINLSFKSLKERKKYLLEGIKLSSYDHHAFKGQKLNIPIKSGKNEMYQLFCHIGFMLNIPILYFDATKRSIHKKRSFKKFYSEVKDKEITDLIKKTEGIRKNWHKHKFEYRKIPKWVVNQIGKDYMNKSKLIIQKIIKLIKNY